MLSCVCQYVYVEGPCGPSKPAEHNVHAVRTPEKDAHFKKHDLPIFVH